MIKPFCRKVSALMGFSHAKGGLVVSKHLVLVLDAQKGCLYVFLLKKAFNSPFSVRNKRVIQSFLTLLQWDVFSQSYGYGGKNV